MRPWASKRFVIPPAPDAAFVARLEDVLAVYRRPVYPTIPVVCFDESGKELREVLYPDRPLRPAHPRLIDDQDTRHGSASLLLTVAPLHRLAHRPDHRPAHAPRMGVRDAAVGRCPLSGRGADRRGPG
ncbi:MAG: hypothetical protein ACR2OE_16120 [Thermomicrobiales bacterium]